MDQQRRHASARAIGPAFFLAATLAVPAARAAAPDDHGEALAALTDTRAAMGEIEHAEDIYSTDKSVYYDLAQRALNALMGARSEYYSAGPGNPGDKAGAIGHIDRLLDRQANPPWVAALHGAEANIRAAAANLVDARAAHELMDFQMAASRALRHLDVALGRPNQTDVFGGLEGAIATTALGVPPGATELDACAPPSARQVQGAPVFGMRGGYVAYVAVPATQGTHALPGPIGGSEVSLKDGALLLHTAAMPLVAKLCAQRTAVDSPIRRVADTAPDPANNAASGSGSGTQGTSNAADAAQTGTKVPHPTAAEAQQAIGATAQASTAAGAVPALYTMAQAEAGKKIFQQNCVTCHGTNLQGTAAPSVAGKDFLNTAKTDGWTVEVIRYIVFDLMPRNSPGTLQPEQSADVMAYLLASNCYPAGNKPFPAKNESDLSKIKMQPVPGPHPGANKYGVCPVK
jgi:polar amino acid transport system substrate-binding protein